MIIIPAEKTLDWRRPPIATIALILVNCVVFFGYQSGDGARLEAATNYYTKSGLLQREAPLYMDYIASHAALDDVVRIKRAVQQESTRVLVPIIARSNDFSRFIRDGVKAGRLPAADWDDNRKTFTALQGKLSFMAYGFVPAQFSPVGFITSMFLHGSIDHLVGNMIFLFICGFALEVAFGRLWFLGLYLVSGCLATLFSYATSFNSAVPQIGASGAIAGLMGMYAALYGVRQIRFFYWIAVFIGYFTAPALLIFPIWVANEIFGALFGASYVNYYAHVGGLLAGFGLVYFARDKFLDVDEQYIEEEVSEEELYRQRTDEMWQLAGKLKFDQARKLGAELLAEHPNDRQVLEQLYNVAKANPASPYYHKVAGRIFASAGDDTLERFKLHVLSDYLAEARDPGALDLGTCVALARPVCLAGLTREAYALAERLIHFNERDAATRSPEVCKALFRVLMAQLKEGLRDEANRLLEFLRTAYPDAEETSMALESVNLRAGT